eukprot:g10766.t1
MTQLVAHGHELFVLCRDEVLALSPQSSSVRRIPWPHCKLLALDGAVVRHRRTVALLQRAGGAGSVPVQRLEDDPEAFQRATQVLRTRDLELVTHLEILAGDLPVLLQPMVSCLLSRSLPRSSWLVLWDHLIVAWQQPQLLLPAALAVLRSKRQLLLHLESFQRVRDLILSPTRTDTARLLSEFYALWEASGALPVCSNSPVPEQDSEFLRALEQLESGGPEVEVVIDLDPKQAEDFLLFRQQIHRASVPEVAPNAEGEVGERWPTPQKMGMDCSLDTTALEIPEMWHRIVVIGHGAFFAALLGRYLANCEVADFVETTDGGYERHRGWQGRSVHRAQAGGTKRFRGGTVQEADQEQASASSKGRREGSHATASWVRSGPVRTAVSAGHRGVSEGRATELEEA